METEHQPIRPSVPQQHGPITEDLPLFEPQTAVGPAEARRHRARWAIALGVVLVAAGVAVTALYPFSSGGTHPSSVVDSSYPTGLQSVSRQDLSSQTEVSATLGFSGSYSVVNQASGTVTWLPAVGQVIKEGQALYDVSGSPVVLLYGTTPAYRALSEGATDSATSGADVENLNYDLVALGYLSSADNASEPSDFTAYTKAGVEKLQAALGVTQNGSLSLGQVVFLPAAVRITSLTATLAASAQSGQSVMSATSTTRQVSIALDAGQQSEVKVGDKVTITLPNGETTPGVITSVGTVATTSSGGSSPTITVLVTPSDPAATGAWDQTPVNVTITTGTVTNALVVPIDALLAQSRGGYAVEVADADGSHHLVSVTLGLTDDADGLVQVSSSGLVAGQRVVVPKL